MNSLSNESSVEGLMTCLSISFNYLVNSFCFLCSVFVIFSYVTTVYLALLHYHRSLLNMLSAVSGGAIYFLSFFCFITVYFVNLLNDHCFLAAIFIYYFICFCCNNVEIIHCTHILSDTDFCRLLCEEILRKVKEQAD